MHHILGILNRLSKTSVYLIALLAVFLIGWLDYATGAELSLSFFYLLPIITIIWKSGKTPGIVFSLFSTVIWFVSNKLAGQEHSNILIFYWNAAIRASFFITITLLLAEIRVLLEKESNLSRTDPLTGVLNRRAFYEFAEYQIETLKRVFRPFTVIYFDIDDFKNINDQFGHQIGDLLLKKIAESILGLIRSTDKFVRLGGDEFMLYLPETGTDESHAVASRLFEKINRTMEENKWPVSFSLGVMTFLKIPRSIDEMLRLADDLMYEAKKSGKNIIQYDTYV
jgi:diguanylate cyclase (GGDEF)-like protein